MPLVTDKYNRRVQLLKRYAIEYKIEYPTMKEYSPRPFCFSWSKYYTMESCLQGLKDLKENHKLGYGSSSLDGGKTWHKAYIHFRPIHLYYKWQHS